MTDIKEMMDCLKKKAIEAIEVYTKKDNWKQEDLNGAKDAVKLYNEVCDAQMKDGIWEEMKDDWSRTSYGTPHGYTRMSYGHRGRDSMGRYMSGTDIHNDMYYDPRYMPMMHDDRVSGHSVKDRMIAALEEQMDSAKTEYERDEIRKAIAEIERMKR